MIEQDGFVLDLHGHGALVRLLDGRLAALPAAECEAHAELVRLALRDRCPVRFLVEEAGRRPALRLAETRDVGTPRDSSIAPEFTDSAFEARMTHYLRSLEDGRTPGDEPDPAERERLRKARRARGFEAPPGHA